MRTKTTLLTLTLLCAALFLIQVRLATAQCCETDGDCGEGYACTGVDWDQCVAFGATCEQAQCVPMTADNCGSACGPMPDGCGGPDVDCGECAPGGPAPGPGCTPATWCDPGLYGTDACGLKDDGCGTSTVDCGACPDPGAGGDPVCTPTCPPGSCGTQPDGCGGSLFCGDCSSVPEGSCTVDSECPATICSIGGADYGWSGDCTDPGQSNGAGSYAGFECVQRACSGVDTATAEATATYSANQQVGVAATNVVFVTEICLSSEAHRASNIKNDCYLVNCGAGAEGADKCAAETNKAAGYYCNAGICTKSTVQCTTANTGNACNTYSGYSGTYCSSGGVCCEIGQEFVAGIGCRDTQECTEAGASVGGVSGSNACCSVGAKYGQSPYYDWTSLSAY